MVLNNAHPMPDQRLRAASIHPDVDETAAYHKADSEVSAILDVDKSSQLACLRGTHISCQLVPTVPHHFLPTDVCKPS